MSFRPVYIVDGARTPFLKARHAPGLFSASDLAVQAGRALLMRQPFAPGDLDEVIVGCANSLLEEANIGRVVSLRLGCGYSVPAWTAMRNYASGMQAVDSAMSAIQSGRSQLVLAGGSDALSYAPLIYNHKMVSWFSEMSRARTPWQKLTAFAKLRPKALFSPVAGIEKGLTDPVVGLTLGQTAENLAWKFGISRAQMDAFALRSHRLAAQVQGAGNFGEIVPLIDYLGRVYTEDNGVRADSHMGELSALKPAFDKKYGNITVGNTSQASDGAAWVILASEAAVEKWGLKPLGKISDSQWAGLDPAQMGLGPVHAATPLLQQHGWGFDDIDAWEINESFAAQVLACLAAWSSEEYCREQLGLPGALGNLPLEKLNVNGGAIALGHPVGASGARIVLHLVHVLRSRGRRRGIASLCIGGGQGGAMLVEPMA